MSKCGVCEWTFSICSKKVCQMVPVVLHAHQQIDITIQARLKQTRKIRMTIRELVPFEEILSALNSDLDFKVLKYDVCTLEKL